MSQGSVCVKGVTYGPSYVKLVFMSLQRSKCHTYRSTWGLDYFLKDQYVVDISVVFHVNFVDCHFQHFGQSFKRLQN